MSGKDWGEESVAVNDGSGAEGKSRSRQSRLDLGCGRPLDHLSNFDHLIAQTLA